MCHGVETRRHIESREDPGNEVEVELLLGVVRAYSSQKNYEGLEWESVKSKYEDIRKDFVTLYEQQDSATGDVSTRSSIHFGFTANSKDRRRKNIRIRDQNRFNTRQNFPDSKVFGFKVPTLDSGFKISGDTTT